MNFVEFMNVFSSHTTDARVAITAYQSYLGRAIDTTEQIIALCDEVLEVSTSEVVRTSTSEKKAINEADLVVLNDMVLSLDDVVTHLVEAAPLEDTLDVFNTAWGVPAELNNIRSVGLDLDFVYGRIENLIYEYYVNDSLLT